MQESVRYILEPVIKGLLGNTVVVDNMDTAIKLANDSHFGFKIVTLDGDIINPAGSITGGSKKTALNNLLSRDREIEDVELQLKSRLEQLSTTKANLQKHIDMVANLNTQIETNTVALHNCEIEFAQKEEAYKFASENSENYDLNLKELNEEKTRIATKIELLGTKLQTAKSLDSSGLLTDASGQPTSQFDALRNERDTLSNQLMEFKVNIATLEGEISAIDAEIKRLLNEQERINQDMDETSSLLVKSTKTMETAIQLSADSQDTKEAEEQQSALSAVQTQINKLEEVKTELHNTIEKIGAERDRLANELSHAKEKNANEEQEEKDKTLQDEYVPFGTIKFEDENYQIKQKTKEIATKTQKTDDIEEQKQENEKVEESEQATENITCGNATMITEDKNAQQNDVKNQDEYVDLDLDKIYKEEEKTTISGIKCLHCGYINQPNAIYCDICENKLK